MTRALVAALLALPTAAAGQVELEHVAHACFVVESPGGTRIAVDPYSGTRWLGFGFPDDLDVDAVLITHPHYDHDASAAFPERVPVLREAGSYAVGDVRIEGIAGRHADPYGREFGQVNTLWRLETGGLRLAHLGDTGPPTPETAAALGPVDVLMLPVDGLDHILKPAEIDAWRAALSPRITVPMHYRHDELAGLPESLGPVDPWLEGRDFVVRSAESRVRLEPDAEGAARVLVLPPRPGLPLWPAALREAWDRRAEIRTAIESGEAVALERALVLLRAASAAVPEAMLVQHQLARALVAARRSDEATRSLERALLSAGLDDLEYTLRCRTLLAELYAGAGRDDEAALQYRLVLRSAWRHDLRDGARAFLEGRP